jgi:RNA polymerase-interacting CarD/CdnL/TRCF family regulator
MNKTLEQQYSEALKRGDHNEAARLARLMERLDEQRRAFGKDQRG